LKASAAILLLWALLVLPGIMARDYWDPWDPDEARYGEVAREVWRGDGALVPHLAGREYHEKPPLFFWIVAGVQALSGGAGAPVSRIPSALATLFTAYLVLLLVRRSHGEREGTLAAAVFLTCALVVQLAGWIAIDPLVTLLVTVCVAVQDRALATGRTWRHAALTYALLAAIVLTKGPPVIIAILAMASAAWLTGGLRGLARTHLLWGIPLLLALLAAWAVPAAGVAEDGWSYIRGLTLGQAERRLIDSESHPKPLFYYLTRFPAFFLPWAVLLPAMALVVRSECREGRERRNAILRYVLWFAVPFVLFSLVSGKRERYILPLFVPAAAVAGIAIVRLRDLPWARFAIRLPLHVMLGLLGLIGVAMAASPFFLDAAVLPRVTEALSDLPPSAAVAQLGAFSDALGRGTSVVVAGGVSAAFIAIDGILRRRGVAPVLPLCAAMAAIVFTLSVGLLPAFDRLKSYRAVVAETLARAPADASYVIGGLQPGPFCLALDSHDVDELPRLALPDHTVDYFREHPDETVVVFAMLKDQLWTERILGEKLWTLAARRVGGRVIVSFRRFPKE